MENLFGNRGNRKTAFPVPSNEKIQVAVESSQFGKTPLGSITGLKVQNPVQ